MTVDHSPYWVTLKLAVVTTVMLLLVGIPLAWWLARTKTKLKPIIEATIALPLILPPTVIGFYLLLALGPHGWIGQILDSLGLKPLAFTFSGLVVGSMCYSLPFVVQPLHNAFNSINTEVLEAASTLGASPLDRFFFVVLPLAKSGILTATILGFAHTVGEFGVVLMIGGNIPGKTQVLSVALYDHVENLEYIQAHSIAGQLLLVSFFLLFLIYYFNRKFSLVKP